MTILRQSMCAAVHQGKFDAAIMIDVSLEERLDGLTLHFRFLRSYA